VPACGSNFFFAFLRWLHGAHSLSYSPIHSAIHFLVSHSYLILRLVICIYWAQNVRVHNAEQISIPSAANGSFSSTITDCIYRVGNDFGICAYTTDSKLPQEIETKE
jgi:hypothetical protein